MALWNSVNIGSGNGLLPKGTKPLPELMLTKHQWHIVAFTQRIFHRKCHRYLLLIWVWNPQIASYCIISQAPIRTYWNQLKVLQHHLLTIWFHQWINKHLDSLRGHTPVTSWTIPGAVGCGNNSESTCRGTNQVNFSTHLIICAWHSLAFMLIIRYIGANNSRKASYYYNSNTLCNTT